MIEQPKILLDIEARMSIRDSKSITKSLSNGRTRNDQQESKITTKEDLNKLNHYIASTQSNTELVCRDAEANSKNSNTSLIHHNSANSSGSLCDLPAKNPENFAQNLVITESSSSDYPINNSGISNTSPSEIETFDQPRLSIKEYIQSGHIELFSAQRLQNYLDRSADYSSVKSDKAIHQPLSVLLIDTRPSTLYQNCSIKGSINIQFPALVLKRLKKSMFSNFNIANFILDDKSIRQLEIWRALPNKTIVVYDETMYIESQDSDAWIFLRALCLGLPTDISNQLLEIKNTSVKFCYLEGGFTKFAQGCTKDILSYSTNNPKTEQLGEACLDSKITHVKDSSMGPATSKRLSKLTLSISALPKASKNINQTNKNKLADANEDVEHKNMSGSQKLVSPTSAVSATDIVASVDPYSVITKNLVIGSDLLPLSPNGKQELSDLGVTHILNMAAEITPSKSLEECGQFLMKWIPVYDNIEEDMEGALHEAINFISHIIIDIGSAILNDEKAIIFVHCKAGRSRSVSAVIGYLVAKERYTVKMAYDTVRKVRRGVSPNLGFMAALLNLERHVLGENSSIPEI